MASSSKNLEPIHNDAEALEEHRRQLRCINRRCSYGDTLVSAVDIACSYYNVDYKPGKEVCLTCLKKCLKHYKYLEMRWREGKCILDATFPCFNSYVVIEDSSGEEEEDEEEEEEEKQKPSTSKVGLPPDPVVKKIIDSAIEDFFEKNHSLCVKQAKLCDEFLDKGIKECEADMESLDEFILDLDKQMAVLNELVFGPYEPIVTSLEPVDINELEENMEVEQVEVTIPQIEINKPIEEIEMPKAAKRRKLDNSDKDDIITINRTTFVVPENIPVEGPLENPVVEGGQTVYAMKLTNKDPWSIGKIKNIVNEDYVHVVFQTGEKLVTTKQIAYPTLNSVRFPVGCRVIAKFTDPNSKRVDEFYAGIVAEPPKMLNRFRYLIFFDDGNVQYRDHADIRLIVRSTLTNAVWKDVEKNSQDFIKSYLEKYPERLMVKLTNKHSVRAEHQGQWQMAKVLEVDASLVKLYFTEFKHSEWIYRGSSRLYNIFEKQSKSERGIRLRQSGLAYLEKPFVEFTSVEEEPPRLLARSRKNTSKNSTDGTQKLNKSTATKVVHLILPEPVLEPLKYRKHKCSPLCVEWTGYDYHKTRTFSMLTIPLHFGFERIVATFNESQKCIFYKTPCGVTIRNMDDMMKYLIVTNSEITIDQFDFSGWFRPFAEYKVIKSIKFLEDISDNQEFRGIPCVNIINGKLPPLMNYMTTRQPMPGVNINLDSKFLCGCDCTDNCQDKSKCSCWLMTLEGQKILPKLYKDPADIGYSHRRLPERVLTGIYECNRSCKCSSSCSNRVVQNPLSHRLQLFMTEKKGWGVQCLNDIPQGSFICVYVGYLLTETDANEGGKNYGDEYLAELDYIEVIEKIKEDYESEVPDSDTDHETAKNQSESSDEHYPSTSDGRRSEMSLRLRKRTKSKTKRDGKNVQALSKLNARNMKNNPEPPKSVREYFGRNESVYIMDAKTNGNIGRYLNHSCCPNTYVQNVFVDTHDLRFPWVSFFALHYISAGTELTWDYRYDIGSVPGKNMKCHCETVFCRGRLL